MEFTTCVSNDGILAYTIFDFWLGYPLFGSRGVAVASSWQYIVSTDDSLGTYVIENTGLGDYAAGVIPRVHNV